MSIEARFTTTTPAGAEPVSSAFPDVSGFT
jgi:hypothetical protein